MNKRINILSTSFITISSLILFMGIDLLKIAITSYSQFFITVCGEIFKNIRKHIHLNPDATIPSLIIIATTIGISLAFIQIIKFIFSHQSLKKHKQTNIPQKLNKIINKHHLQHIPFIVKKENKLIAHTTGLLKPHITISNSLIKKTNTSQLEAIILHEAYHAQKRHIPLLLLIKTTTSLLFFIPLLKYLAQQLKTEFEISADTFVIQKQKTRNHLRSSLAFNLQHTNNLISHFASLPIEKRVELLTTNKTNLDKIKTSTLGISLISITFMLGIILTGPNQVTATFNSKINNICQIDTQCQTTDCIKHSNQNTQIPISHSS